MNYDSNITTLFKPASHLLPSKGSRPDQGGCDFPLPVIRTDYFQLLVDEKERSIIMRRLKYMVDFLISIHATMVHINCSGDTENYL